MQFISVDRLLWPHCVLDEGIDTKDGLFLWVWVSAWADLTYIIDWTQSWTRFHLFKIQEALLVLHSIKSVLSNKCLNRIPHSPTMCPWIFRYLHTQISTVYLRFEHLFLTHRVVITSNKEGGPHHEPALQTADSQSPSIRIFLTADIRIRKNKYARRNVSAFCLSVRTDVIIIGIVWICMQWPF